MCVCVCVCVCRRLGRRHVCIQAKHLLQTRTWGCGVGRSGRGWDWAWRCGDEETWGYPAIRTEVVRTDEEDPPAPHPPGDSTLRVPYPIPRATPNYLPPPAPAPYNPHVPCLRAREAESFASNACRKTTTRSAGNDAEREQRKGEGETHSTHNTHTHTHARTTSVSVRCVPRDVPNAMGGESERATRGVHEGFASLGSVGSTDVLFSGSG